MGGQLFENLVAAEIYKTLAHRGEDPLFYFWRTADGAEVDFIVETREGIIPIEVKLSSTIQSRMARNITSFSRDFGEDAGMGFVVHPAETTLPLGQNTTAIPFSAF